MKYGQLLTQRSVPQWGHYNIDYDYLKDLIKHHTTPGTNKAVSIPGQGGSTESEFRDALFEVLKTQHDRINLFVRSKSGEIARRLEHISKTLEQLWRKDNAHLRGARISAKTIEQYARIDEDVTRIGEEIRSLSRFQVVQKTGFTKILKKYKRWTRDKELSLIFKEQIISRPDSLFQMDLAYLLDQYIDVLGALRSVTDTDSDNTKPDDDTNIQSSAARLSRSITNGDELDFDLALTTIPLGSRGSKAVYWVHLDHLVEVQVLLLQHMRLYASNARTPTRNGSTTASPHRRRSSTTTFNQLPGEDDVGVVILDHKEAFALKQNSSTIGATEESQGSIGTRALGNVRCLSSGKAAVVICPGDRLYGQSSSDAKIARLERSSLKAILDPTSDSDHVKHSQSLSEESAGFATSHQAAVQMWLSEHESTKPIVGTVSKRTRFIGLNNNSAGGLWASLDRDICMKADLHKDLEYETWASDARSKSIRFPHAVLEVRREGIAASSLIQTLNRSHLVERVRGFSLETHAVWTCCKPSAMSSPTWIPLLDQDIRKLPEPVKRRSRKARVGTVSSHGQLTPPQTSTSNTSFDGQFHTQASRTEENCATPPTDPIHPPSLRAYRKKKRSPTSDYAQATLVADSEPETQQRYWNEYDHPEDEESGYYIYVDPDAALTYPGQDFFEACIRQVRRILGLPSMNDHSSLSGDEEASTDDDNESGDEVSVLHAQGYGTMPSHDGRREQEGFLGGFLHPFRKSDQHHTLNERRSLLHELENRQHSREMTKMRFYSTSIAAALVIDLILCIMTTTSRKKERGVVDAVVLLGTICTLILCVVAVASMRSRRDSLSWRHQGTLLGFAGAVIGLDVLLLLWVIGI